MAISYIYSMIIDIQSNKCNHDTKQITFLKAYLFISIKKHFQTVKYWQTVVMSGVKSQVSIFQILIITKSLL